MKHGISSHVNWRLPPQTLASPAAAARSKGRRVDFLISDFSFANTPWIPQYHAQTIANVRAALGNTPCAIMLDTKVRDIAP